MEDEVVHQMQPHTLSFHKNLVLCATRFEMQKMRLQSQSPSLNHPNTHKKIPFHSELGYTNRSQLQKNNVLLWIHDIRNAKCGLYQVV
jgi:hypothetical protein